MSGQNATSEVRKLMPKKIDKLVRDGKVAVLYSPGYGAGWSTWMGDESGKRAMFDPDMALVLLGEKTDETIAEVADRKYPNEYHGGLESLAIVWVAKGARFDINEYDGYESVRLNPLDHRA